MGACACCRRRRLGGGGGEGEGEGEWKSYSDREERWLPPSTTAARRHRPSTVSMSSGELEAYVADSELMPRRAAAAERELQRRRELRCT